jgi:hypothetical protein
MPCGQPDPGRPIIRQGVGPPQGIIGVFRCKEHLYKRLRLSVGWSVRPSPTMQLREKLVTSRLLREEEKEEETDYVAIPLRHDSFAPRD